MCVCVCGGEGGGVGEEEVGGMPRRPPGVAPALETSCWLPKKDLIGNYQDSDLIISVYSLILRKFYISSLIYFLWDRKMLS